MIATVKGGSGLSDDTAPATAIDNNNDDTHAAAMNEVMSEKGSVVLSIITNLDSLLHRRASPFVANSTSYPGGQ